jgi:DNA-binding transcriptional regulator LsrR (DeoR family)
VKKVEPILAALHGKLLVRLIADEIVARTTFNKI